MAATPQPRYSVEQLAVLNRVLARPGSPLVARFAVLSGPPGSGKSTLAKGIGQGFEYLWGPGCCMALSPTGKAARRFTEITDQPCSTIHRALIPWERAAEAAELGNDTREEWNAADGIVPRGALRAVIVDEASMVDMQLFLRLLKALPPWLERIVLIGDADQLPSVGAGCILRDIIASGCVPAFFLTEIFRQDIHSWIRVNTQRINRGERPISDPESTDWFEEMNDDIGAGIDRVVALAKEHPDAQVLTPTHKGPLGATNLNRLVREAVNPAAGREPWRAGDLSFFRGDRVIHVKNDYDRDVFNGEVGVVVGPVGDELAVDYDGRNVLYDVDAAEERLRLAFCLTIHKSQASEYADVIAVIHSTHSFLLSRQLAYVAASRAKKRAWIVGNDKGVRHAVRSNQTLERRTRLAERLREAFAVAGATP